jgi:hypothetical protein
LIRTSSAVETGTDPDRSSRAGERGGESEVVEQMRLAVERMREISQAAERAIEAIRAEPEVDSPTSEHEATGGSSGARRDELISELSRRVIDEAGAIKQRSDQVLAVLERSLRAAEDEQPPTPRWRPKGARKEQQGASEGVRLLVAQMAVAGNSPAEIAERLRRDYGVSNARSLVAEVFGEKPK